MNQVLQVGARTVEGDHLQRLTGSLVEVFVKHGFCCSLNIKRAEAPAAIPVPVGLNVHFAEEITQIRCRVSYGALLKIDNGDRIASHENIFWMEVAMSQADVVEFYLARARD